MDNQKVKKNIGRLAMVSEAEKKLRHAAYMRNTPWECTVCSKAYTTGGKWSHLSTRNHCLNYTRLIDELRKSIGSKGT